MKNLKKRRKTSETDIKVELSLYGKGKYEIKTGIPFLDHMLCLFAKHGLFDLKIKATGDLDVDMHHTNEDVGIVLGEAFSTLLGNRAGIKRFADATVPMDEALVRIAVDISGRPFLKFCDSSKETCLRKAKKKTVASLYDLVLAEHFLRAFVFNSGITAHVDILNGGDPHHVIEAVFKAFAKALSKAIEVEPRSRAIPSTKGRI